MQENRGYIIAVTNSKGGAGKSTACQNIACEFVHQGYKVAILDADHNQESISEWGIRREFHSEQTGVDPLNPAVRLVSGDIRHSIQEAALANDIVIIDVAGRRSKELSSSLYVSDLILIPAAPTIKDLEVIPLLVEELEMTEIGSLEHRKAYGFLNKVGSTTSKGKKRQQLALKLFQEYAEDGMISGLFEPISTHDVFIDADEEGVGITELDDNSAGARKARAQTQLLTAKLTELLANIGKDDE